MKNILNIDIRSTISYGYTNEGCSENSIIVNFIIEGIITNPLIEVTKIDGSIETFNYERYGTNITFDIFQAPGTVKVRFLSNELNSEYININITEEIGFEDNAIVKIIDGEISVRKVKAKTTTTTEETFTYITSEDILSLFT